MCYPGWTSDPLSPVPYQPSADAQRRLHELLPRLSQSLDEMGPLLERFLEGGQCASEQQSIVHLSTPLSAGISMINTVQQNRTSGYLNMTTIAAFFSGVTASTLQFTFTETSSGLDNAVNTLLFSSLIFSIASAVNSLLVMSWKRSFVYVHHLKKISP